jgi:RecA-family ATPase/5S rRNA maturation endonuclease (ribonuclease M5)
MDCENKNMPNYLQLYESHITKIKKTGENQFIGSCPFHGKDEKPSFSFNTSDGLFNCFSCGTKGNSYTFSELVGIETKAYGNGTPITSNGQPYQVSKEKRNGHVREIRDSFLSESDRKRAYSYHTYLTDNFEKLTHGLPWNLEAVKKTFTGYDSETERFTFLHTDKNGKAVNVKFHKDKDGNSPFSIKGHGKCRLYPLHLLKDYNSKTPLIICEGEKDVIALISHNFQAITSTTGAVSFPKDITPLKRFKIVYILYDNDEAGRTGSVRLAKVLKKQSPQGKIIISTWNDKPKRYDLTDHFSQDKDELDLMDEFDLILTNGKEFELPKPKPKGYNLMTSNKFKQSDYKQSVSIVDEILTENGFGSIAGSDGVGKSFLALQFAVSCAMGVPFLDYKTTRPYKILFIQFELENGELKFRFNKMLKWFYHTYPNAPGNVDNLSIASLEADTIIFSNQWQKIEHTIKESGINFDILIIDNLYTSTSVNISDAKQLTPLLGEITRICKENKLAVMLINHHTKKTVEVKSLEKDMIRGGKDLTNWLTNCIQIGESSLSQDLRVFKITKQRSGKGYTNGIPQALKWDTDNLVFHRIGTIEREELHFIDPKTKPEFEAIRKVEPYATNKLFTASQFEAVVMDEMNYSPRTVFNWLHKLESWKVIKKIDHGNYRILKSELDKYNQPTA